MVVARGGNGLRGDDSDVISGGSGNDLIYARGGGLRVWRRWKRHDSGGRGRYLGRTLYLQDVLNNDDPVF